MSCNKPLYATGYIHVWFLLVREAWMLLESLTAALCF